MSGMTSRFGGARADVMGSPASVGAHTRVKSGRPSSPGAHAREGQRDQDQMFETPGSAFEER